MEKRSSFRIAEWDYRVPTVIRENKTEFYVDIPNYEGLYQISNLNNVRSWINNKGNRRKEPKILKQYLDHKGYPKVSLYKNGKIKHKLVHQLMWLAWRGEIPEGMQINHINEIKTDNRLDNLNLMTCKENVNWGTRNERISKSVIQKSLDGKVIKKWSSLIEIERELGYSHGNICDCCRGKFRQRYGYIWQYED